MGSYSTHWWLKDRMALRYGDVFLVVSPGLLCCVVSNADAITEILGNRERFPKPLENYESLSMYGPSIFTVRHQSVSSLPAADRRRPKASSL